FHVWALEWYDDRLDILVDDEKLFSYRKESNDPAVWPFDQPHYLILNLAIGGAWGGQKGVDEEIFPQKFLIDYVRVYELAEKSAKPAAKGEEREEGASGNEEEPAKKKGEGKKGEGEKQKAE